MSEHGPIEIDRWYKPFYLSMMNRNAIVEFDSIRDALFALPEPDPWTVKYLLRRNWRTTVMGAWLSLRLAGHADVEAAVIDALLKSQGSLTAPPLITAVSLIDGPQEAAALDAVDAYRVSDEKHGWGCSGLAAAFLKNFGRYGAAVSEDDERDRADMTVIALDIAKAWPDHVELSSN